MNQHTPVFQYVVIETEVADSFYRRRDCRNVPAALADIQDTEYLFSVGCFHAISCTGERQTASVLGACTVPFIRVMGEEGGSPKYWFWSHDWLGRLPKK